MERPENFRFAAAFGGLSGALHLVAPLVSGFASGGWMLALAGAISLAMAYGLMTGLRWLAWIAFFWFFGGVIGSLTFIWSSGEGPDWLFAIICLANTLTVLGLFLALWRSPQTFSSE